MIVEFSFRYWRLYQRNNFIYKNIDYIFNYIIFLYYNNMDYKAKYINYKEKYLKYKAKYKDYKIKYYAHIKGKESEFRNVFKDDIKSGLLQSDFIHDIKSKVKDEEYYDMLNAEKIIITSSSNPEDLESFLHNELINLNSNEESLLESILSKSSTPNKQINFNSYTIILDKSADNNEMLKKLATLFNITKFDVTFVGTCEQLLTSKTIIMDNQFMKNKKELKLEYIIEAIKIGFFPISKNGILKHSTIDIEMIKIFAKEALQCIKKYKINKEFHEDFIKDLQYILDYKNPTNENTIVVNAKYKKNNDKSEIDKKLERVVYSVKEARDIFYIEEIKKKELLNKDTKYILVSNDLLQCYRAIVDNISCINLVLSIIRFIAIYDNNELYFFGNPFELISTQKEIIKIYESKHIKDIVNNILSNPIIRMKRNVSINTKYFFDNYNKIHNQKYLKEVAEIFVDDWYSKNEHIIDMISEHIYLDIYDIKQALLHKQGLEDYEEISSLENLNKKKEIMDYLLNFAKNNIHNKEDLINVFETLEESHPTQNFDSILKKINKLQTDNIDYLQYQIFYLTTLYKNITDLDYIEEVAKELNFLV